MFFLFLRTPYLYLSNVLDHSDPLKHINVQHIPEDNEVDFLEGDDNEHVDADDDFEKRRTISERAAASNSTHGLELAGIWSLK